MGVEVKTKKIKGNTFTRSYKCNTVHTLHYKLEREKESS